MSIPCHFCGSTGVLPCDDLEAKVEEKLRAACDDAGIVVSVTGTVTEADAARLVDRAPTTLANWRYAERSIPFRRINGRIRYALSDLARWQIENEI